MEYSSCPGTPASPSISAPPSAASGAAYTVSWSGTSPDNTYELQEATNPSFSGATTYPVTGTSRNFNHLVGSSTTYYYRVRAKDHCNGSDYYSSYSGSAATTVEPICTTPAPPSISAPSSAASGDDYTVSWSGTSPDNTYELQEAANPSFSGATTYSVTGTSRNFNHLVGSSTTYYYRVRAKDNCNGSDYYSSYSGTAATTVEPICTNPAPPAISAPSSAASGADYTVSWSATSPDNTYELQEATNPSFSGATTYSVTGTSRNFNHLVGSSTTYYYRVRAKDHCNGSDYYSSYSGSAATTVEPGCTIPAPPSISAPSSAASGADYTVSWSATSPDNTYELQEATNPSFSGAITYSVTGTSRSFNHLVGSSTTYYYRVRAKDHCNGSDYYSSYSNSAPTTITSCSAALTPASQAFGPLGGSGTFSVTSDCGTWTALADVPWIVITGAASGSDDGTVSYLVERTSEVDPRSGTISLPELGLSFGVEQEAAPTSPGYSSSLLLVSGTVAGQQVDSVHRDVVISPGAQLSGSVTMEVNSTFGSNAVMALGMTPSWGDHDTSYTDLGTFSGPVSGWQRTETIDFTAPTTPGVYHVIAAFNGEFNAAQVLSATNWTVGSVIWNNGDDVAGWSQQTIDTANTYGTVLVDYLHGTAGNVRWWMPATAIRIMVGTPIFTDGFESGDLSAWSQVVAPAEPKTRSWNSY